MPRLKPHITVTAVVSPAIVEELDRLAAANQVTRSTMIRQLLEASLTQRANERLDSAYERLEKRLAKMEERFSSLIVKSVRAAAQGMYLAMHRAQVRAPEARRQIHAKALGRRPRFCRSVSGRCSKEKE